MIAPGDAGYPAEGGDVLEREVGVAPERPGHAAHDAARAQVGHQPQKIAAIGKEVAKQRRVALRARLVEVAAQRLERDHQADVVAALARRLGVHRAALLCGEERRRLLVDERHEAHGQRRRQRGEVARDLEHRRHAAAVVVGPGAAAHAVVVRADQEDLARPAGARADGLEVGAAARRRPRSPGRSPRSPARARSARCSRRPRAAPAADTRCARRSCRRARAREPRGTPQWPWRMRPRSSLHAGALTPSTAGAASDTLLEHGDNLFGASTPRLLSPHVMLAARRPGQPGQDRAECAPYLLTCCRSLSINSVGSVCQSRVGSFELHRHSRAWLEQVEELA